jgi:broad specificity phosphatase PhoE
MLRCLALLLCLLPLEAATIILVRHAEKAGPTGDVPLNDLGLQRAALLAKTLADVKLTAIYTTELQRTKQTAQPLAKAQAITPTILEAKDLAGLLKQLKAAAPTDIILVVSHSNLVPTIAESLAAKLPPMDDADYSRLIVINTTASPASLITLRYGP